MKLYALVWSVLAGAAYADDTCVDYPNFVGGYQLNVPENVPTTCADYTVNSPQCINAPTHNIGANSNTAGSNKACCNCGGGADGCASDPYWEIVFNGIAGKARCEDFANYGDVAYGSTIKFCDMKDNDNITGHEACCECGVDGALPGGVAYNPWKIELNPNTFTVNSTEADDATGLVINFEMLAGQRFNRSELVLYSENCTDQIGSNSVVLSQSDELYNTGLNYYQYERLMATIELDPTQLRQSVIWTQGSTASTGIAAVCARTNLYYDPSDPSDRTNDMMVSFQEVQFYLGIDLTNNTFEIATAAEDLEFQNAGIESIADEYEVEACFCTGGFTCDADGTTVLSQNGLVEVCLNPKSGDTEIRTYNASLTQVGNTYFDTNDDIPVVVDGSPQVLTTVTEDVPNDIKKFTNRLLGLFFDLPGGAELPPISAYGAADLQFKEGNRRRMSSRIDTSRMSRQQWRRTEENIFAGDVATSDAIANAAEASGFDLEIQIERAEGNAESYFDGMSDRERSEHHSDEDQNQLLINRKKQMDASGAGALTSSASAALALIVIIALGSTW